MKILLLALSLIFAVTNFAFGETYKWVDEKGVLHFQDHPPQKITPEMKLQKRPSVKKKSRDSTAIAGNADQGKEEKPYDGSILFKLAKETSTKTTKTKVEIYETSWCPYCKKAKNFFRSRGISFTAYDIEKDEAAARRKKRLRSGSGVPLVVINGTVIEGFAPAVYERALKKK